MIAETFSTGDGLVDFQRFLDGLRGRPNKKRKALIDKAFLKFDSMGEGVIRIKDLAQAYNAELHPRVRTKEISNTQAFQEFTVCFNSSNGDGFITKPVTPLIAQRDIEKPMSFGFLASRSGMIITGQ